MPPKFVYCIKSQKRLRFETCQIFDLFRYSSKKGSNTKCLVSREFKYVKT